MTVSVIIPVFRTEQYLEKCVRSVINQTYKNLEIILVDDGSDDSSGALCDSLAAQDSRILVIHKENGGLSSSRNAGIEKAAGDYISFADSDDFMEPDMIEYLLSAESDIACCSHFIVNGGKKIPAPGFDKKTVMNADEAVKELFKDEKLKNYVWNKLFKREFFDDVRFPEGMNFEDIPTTYRLFMKAQSVTVLPGCKYNYVSRPSAISKTVSIPNLFDRFNAHLMRYETAFKFYPEEKGTLLRNMLFSARAFGFALLDESDPAKYSAQAEKCFGFYRDNLKEIESLKELNSFEKKQVRCLSVGTREALKKMKRLDLMRKAGKLMSKL